MWPTLRSLPIVSQKQGGRGLYRDVRVGGAVVRVGDSNMPTTCKGCGKFAQQLSALATIAFHFKTPATF